MRPFRFGFQAPFAETGAEWRALARRAEDLGYSCFYLPDHFYQQWGPLVAMTIAAEATTTLNVGGLVFDNDFRHPLVLAKELATLDRASGGRVECGIGAGWLLPDYDQSGIRFDPAPIRVDRLEEAISILKSLWTQPSTTFVGEHYNLHDAPCFPPPLSSPYPKLIIGGGGKRMLGIAAREADIVSIMTSPGKSEGTPEEQRAAAFGSALTATNPAETDMRVDWVRHAAGSRFEELDLQVLTLFATVTDRRADAAAAIAKTYGIDPEAVATSNMAILGDPEEIVDQLHQRRERWGLNYWVIHPHELEAFAPVVARLCG